MLSSPHAKNLATLTAVLAVGVALFLMYQDKSKHPPTLAEIQFGGSLEDDLRAFGETTDQILGHETAENGSEILSALHYRLEQKIEAVGLSGLTQTERRLMAGTWVEMEVENGGFDQYFYNSSGDESEVALAGLQEMGATASAALLQHAIAVFPDGKPPAERARRLKMMGEIAAKSKAMWDQCDTEFYARKESVEELGLAYAKKKKAEIILPGRK